MQRKYHSLLIAILLLQLSAPNSFAAGRTNQSVANTILNGKGAPTSNIGINGDFYIDISNFTIYGPKTKNRWPAPVSMRGPSGTSTDRVTNVPGTPGEKGEKGAKGDKGESGAAGSPGAQGAKGDAGAKGETGAKGDAGAKGDTGAKGDSGAQGEAGAKGDTGAQGDKGETGAKGDKGDKGDTGDTGPQGPTGATGATGATGPSNVYSGSITFANFLQGSAGSSQSSGNFANLQAGKSYVFDIVIWAYGADENPYLNFSVSTIGASLTLSPIWIRSSSNTFRDNTARTEHAFIGKVAVNGSSVITNFQLAVTVATGFEITSSSKITLTGGYVGQLVGSIS